MPDQKEVCSALGKKLGTTPRWEGEACIIENNDALMIVDKHAAIELKIKNPEKGREIVQTVRQVYMIDK